VAEVDDVLGDVVAVERLGEAGAVTVAELRVAPLSGVGNAGAAGETGEKQGGGAGSEMGH
jgi:hypothetical protein